MELSIKVPIFPATTVLFMVPQYYSWLLQVLVVTMNSTVVLVVAMNGTVVAGNIDPFSANQLAKHCTVDPR